MGPGMAEAHDGTGAGMDLFLEWAGRTGEMNVNTVNAFRSTAAKILEAGEEADGTDVTRLDVDALLGRFENLNRTKYSAGSLQTYKSRFRQAIAMYKAWLVNEPAWKAAGKASSAKSANGVAKSSRPRKATPRTDGAGGEAPVDQHGPAVSGVRMVAYDLPLRPDLLVRLTLPVDLNDDDAARISAFVKSLAFTAGPVPTSQTAASNLSTGG